MISKKTSKILAATLAAGMMASALTACAKKSAEPTANNSTAPSQTSSTMASEKPIEVRIFVQDRSDSPWNNDMPVIKEIAKKTNVTLKWEVAPEGTANGDEKFNLMMASGDLPDIINYDYGKMMKYADKGAYEPLNDLINQNAPNIKKVLENKNISRSITYTNGKIYMVPNIAAIKPSTVMITRKDWMDKLSIKEPTNMDEFYNMLKAMKEKDPNGNGKADEIPFSTRSKRGGIMGITQSWGIREEFFIEDGKMKFGSTDPRMKEVIALLAKMYKEGILDKDYISNDLKMWQARYVNELSGVTYDWLSRIDFLNVEVKKVNQNANFQAVMLPEASKGAMKVFDQQSLVRANGAVIASTSKYKKEIVKMFDYMFTEEGKKLLNFGISGTHYKEENGNITYTDAIMKNPSGKDPQTSLFLAGINRDWPMVKDIRYENAFLSADAKAAVKLYEPKIVDPFPTLNFTDEERQIINSKYTEIKTFKDEMLDRFITGNQPIEGFDDFVKKLQSMGIADVQKVYQAAYDRYLKN
jgi:putative aldouronate transport system substrate-binding protein